MSSTGERGVRLSTGQSRRRRLAGGAAALGLAMLVASCQGHATPPAGVSQTTATLRATASCAGSDPNNPCAVWFQYWTGHGTVRSTPKRTGIEDSDGQRVVTARLTGLRPNTLYHYQVCGYGDGVQPPGACLGRDADQSLATPAGTKPPAWDLSAVQSFRTGGENQKSTVDIGRVLSVGETRENSISRDAGLSVAYSDTRSLWLFGDTIQRGGPSVWGTTAAAGPFTPRRAPSRLREVPTPGGDPTGQPQRFLPTPRGLIAPPDDGEDPQPCTFIGGERYPASWPSGVARIPGTNRVLIAYSQVCVTSAWGGPTQRWSLAEYNPATNRIVGIATPFRAAPLWQGLDPAYRLRAPVFHGQHLYFFREIGEKIVTARVPANAWDDPTRYRWWGRVNGTPRWKAAPTNLVSVVSGLDATPRDVHVARYPGHGFAMLVQTADCLYGKSFQILESGSPNPAAPGGWSGTGSVTLPTPHGCRHIIGHPELSTSDHLVYSWFDTGDLDGIHRGHLRLGGTYWG